MCLQKLNYKEYVQFVNRLYLHNLVWNSLCSRLMKSNLPETRLYSITCAQIEHIAKITGPLFICNVKQYILTRKINFAFAFSKS